MGKIYDYLFKGSDALVNQRRDNYTIDYTLPSLPFEVYLDDEDYMFMLPNCYDHKNTEGKEPFMLMHADGSITGDTDTFMEKVASMRGCTNTRDVLTFWMIAAHIRQQNLT